MIEPVPAEKPEIHLQFRIVGIRCAVCKMAIKVNSEKDLQVFATFHPCATPNFLIAAVIESPEEYAGTIIEIERKGANPICSIN